MNVYPFDHVHEDLGYSPQAHYLFDYAKDLGAETVVLEEQYIDRDYLIDYSKFYARSFTTHERFTKRLHLFSHPFSLEDFRGILKNSYLQHLKILQNSYLGFIVVKPIRDSCGNPLIGRTVIRPYPPLAGQEPRNFIEKEYSASLYGITLNVKSLPFQARDTAVGACATIVLWISLHPLSDLFGIPLNSPAEITEKSVSFPAEYRSFPSPGLSPLQMIAYIKSTGLDLESIDVEPRRSERQKHFVTDAVRAYITSGIPLIATIRLEKDNTPEYHAVVISSYHCDQNGVIGELYVHDPQIGPYCRVVSNKRFIEWENEWTLKFGYDNVFVEKLLIPIYPKVRLIFASIYEQYLRKCILIYIHNIFAHNFLHSN